MNKQICSPEELRKALEVAGFLAFILDIPGELQKQPDGVFLPICCVLIKPDTAQATVDAINVVFNQQVARDWRVFFNTEAIRTTAIDDSIKQDNVIAQIKAMTNAEYDIWWAANVVTTAQAIGVLKRVVRILCRRVL